jgi:hypothetical protein
MGEISIGRLDNLPKGLRLASGEPIQQFSCYGLQIEIRDSKIKGEHFVVLRKEEQYLSILDGNDTLWEGMLFAYGRSINSTDTCVEISGIGVSQ